LKSLLLRKNTRDTRSNESNAYTTKNDLSSNPRQVSASAEKLTSSPTNPHLADDMKDDVEGNNTTRPSQQQEEFLSAEDGGV
jgi:hypothetical protein